MQAQSGGQIYRVLSYIGPERKCQMLNCERRASACVEELTVRTGRVLRAFICAEDRVEVTEFLRTAAREMFRG